LDGKLAEALERAAKKLGITRSAFVRQSIKLSIKETRLRVHVRELEAKQREGYRRKPVNAGEFTSCESKKSKRRVPGGLRGKIRIKKSFDAPLPQSILAGFEGRRF
jgi:hypothetical protein